ncbi:MAG: hypothetical protein H5T41_01775 [Methanomassiliicoccales archaeon]|jgi:hypothetical protein|nr:hypothetical protein [Methanomassiliicoccales archaeon]
MKIVQVKCPSCGTPIRMKNKESVFLCDNCGMMHTRNHGIERIDYEIAEFASGGAGERMYMPFWRLYCDFSIRSKNVEGGSFFRLAQWIKGDRDSGALFVFIPAFDISLEDFKILSTRLTLNPPHYRTTMNFGGVARIPVLLTKEEARELADFVVVTIEAEKPGVLQYLDYSLSVKDERIIYLPFVKTSSGPVLAI